MTEIAPIPKPSAFGVMVRAKRKQLEWSITETAARARVGYSTVRSAELGYVQPRGRKVPVNPPGPKIVRKIALALGLPIAEALEAAGHTPGPDDYDPVPSQRPAEVEIVDLTSRLDPSHQELIADLVKALAGSAAPVEPDRLAS